MVGYCCPVNVTDFKCQLCVSPGDVKCHKFATKGLKKAIAENELLHRKFITCLEEKQKFKVTAKHFRSVAHAVKTVDETKVALSCFDDKRYIMEDGIHTLAYGHYKLEEGNPVSTYM